MNTVLIDVPTMIETERLVLRMPQPGDGRAVNAAIKASLTELQPWLGFARSNPSVEETETNTREANAKFITRESLRYLIFLKDTDEFVGSTGFHNIDWSVRKFEIGYWIDTRMSGNGYMAEAVGKLTELALNELNGKRVEIRCESTNDKSRAVPERLGYELEGILRNEDLSVDGERLTDTCVYGKISGSRMT
ncbi:GNAT family N-acetyltransferase [Rossellomorea vietnamensis]|uniref:GNAT family N-acetyltransferase n=1 Tax=Rossellomorea vietnamensis TaxID=218284 RepID=UPI001E4DD6DB|nr:GNAT family protein [Rossellomorea vietnamensis]MCC5802307.1 GNAT family N-acetyltransferase [Rossellomorea vietnamensis]